jgi:hypothetical protein
MTIVIPTPLVDTRHVSGITIRYPHSQKIGKPNNLNVLVARKPKGLNMKTNID